MSRLSIKYKNIVLFILGFASAYAFAPTYYFPLLFISFPVLLFFLFRASSYKEAFSFGWFFGFGYFLKGLYWMSNALIITGFLWLVPICIILVPAVLAIYVGVVCIVSHRFNNKRSTITFTVLFICCWVLFEIIRSRLFTGFPWLVLGYSFTPWKSFIQSASLGGVFLVSFIILCLVSVPFIIFNTFYNREKTVPSMVVSVICVSILVANYGYGKLRLNNAETKLYDQKVRIVQPNIKQAEKWDGDYYYQNLLKLMSLTARDQIDKDTYIIWPESATSIYSLDNKNVRDFVKQIIPPGAYLLAGGIRRSEDKSKIWNSMFVIDHEGNVLDFYDKMHLVPIGEYVPLRSLIPFGLQKLTYGMLDFSPGDSAKVISINSALPSFRALICYESLFAQDLFTNQDEYPDILINFTNDAWYGETSGPYQHLDMTIFRAVEFGIPMIRAANTGISSISDPYGDVLLQLELNKFGFIEKKIPKPLAKKTFYSINGNLVIIFLIVSLSSISLYAVRKC